MEDMEKRIKLVKKFLQIINFPDAHIVERLLDNGEVIVPDYFDFKSYCGVISKHIITKDVPDGYKVKKLTLNKVTFFNSEEFSSIAYSVAKNLKTDSIKIYKEYDKALKKKEEVDDFITLANCYHEHS